MLRTGAMIVAIAGLLSACGHTPEERLVSGALIGGLVGATVGVVSDPHHGGHRDHHYRKHHRDHHYRKHRRRDREHYRRRHRDYDYYDDY